MTPRTDKIDAKGKGLLQTYWCEPVSGGGSVNLSSECGTQLNTTISDIVPEAQLDRFGGVAGEPTERGGQYERCQC